MIEVVWLGDADAVLVSVTVLLDADCVTVLVFCSVVVLSGCVVDVVVTLLCTCDDAVDAACCACWATVPDPPDPHALIIDAGTAAATSVRASLAPNLWARVFTHRLRCLFTQSSLEASEPWASPQRDEGVGPAGP